MPGRHTLVRPSRWVRARSVIPAAALVACLGMPQATPPEGGATGSARSSVEAAAVPAALVTREAPRGSRGGARVALDPTPPAGPGAAEVPELPTASPTADPGPPAPDPSVAPSPPADPDPTVDPATGPTPTDAPRPGGAPGPDNTGVPPGVVLTVHEGDLTITTPGAVVDSLDVHGFVTIKAPDVTIRNTVVRGRETTSQRALVSSTLDSASVTLIDSELAPADPSSYIDGLRGWNITARRVNIHDVIDSAHLWGSGNTVIEDSWLHDNLHLDQDPQWDGQPSHDDSVQIQEGAGIRIRNNTITGAVNTGIQFTQDRGVVSDVEITGNFLDGGGCTVNFAEKDRGPFQGVTITGNTFGRTTKHENCAIIAPATTRDLLTVADNVYADGAAVRVSDGG